MNMPPETKHSKRTLNIAGCQSLLHAISLAKSQKPSENFNFWVRSMADISMVVTSTPEHGPTYSQHFSTVMRAS
jgi:hypothetical protein